MDWIEIAIVSMMGVILVVLLSSAVPAGIFGRLSAWWNSGKDNEPKDVRLTLVADLLLVRDKVSAASQTHLDAVVAEIVTMQGKTP